MAAAPPPPTRRRFLRTLAILGGATATAAGWPARSARAAGEPTPRPEPPALPTIPAFEAAKVETTELGEALHLLSGPGGNIVVHAAPEGTLVVDSGVRSRAAAVAQAVATLAGGRPVRTLVNTHWHFDHTGGNEFFGRAGARIVAHANVRARLASEQFIETFGFRFPPSPAAALPVATFPDRTTLYSGAERIELLHLEPAHTDGDVAVLFPGADVLHTGDLFFNGFYPVIDYSSGGWIGGMVAAADRLLGLEGLTARTRIVPGHGPVGDAAQLRAARDMLAEVQRRIAPLVQAGRSPEEIAAAKPTADLDAQWAHGLLQADPFVKMVAVGLARHG